MSRPDRGELAFDESDEALSLLAGLKDHAFYRLDADGRVLTWNEGARAVEGYAEHEILGEPLARFYAAEDVASGVPERLLEMARNEGRAERDGWRVRKDGALIWARVVIAPVRDRSGRLRGYWQLIQDLSELHRAEERIRRGEQQPWLLVHAVEDYAIFMLDSQGRVASWNRGAEQIKGYQEKEIMGRHMSIFYTREDKLRGKPAELLRRASADGRVQDEGWRLKKNGSRFWANVVITRLNDDSGRLIGFAKVTRDLTARKAVEDELREREQRMRAMIDGIHDHAIFMLDAAGRIASWNDAAAKVSGYAAEEILGRPLAILYAAEEAAEGKVEADLRTAGEKGHAESEGWRVRKSGERFWADVTISAIHGSAGELVGFTTVTRDLSERRRLERTLWENRIAANEAQLALRGRDEFISAAAHELRTPLTALQLRLQGLEQALSGAGTRLIGAQSLEGRIEGAVKQAERLSELVDRLLDVSRIANGKLQLHSELFDLVELARGIVDDFSAFAGVRGSELIFTGKGPVFGTWDRTRIGQVLTHLLTNAVKYGRGKAVDVRVDATGETALLVVSDRGIGIASADVERIFSRFERAAPISHYGGFGLGLYLTRCIVKAHGGSIRVQSNPEQGSTFAIELPTKPAQAQADSALVDR